MHRERSLMQKNVVAIANRTRATMVCRHAEVADTFATRLIGLLGRGSLEPGAGLLLEPANGTHTWGMKFALDIVTLDQGRCVVGLWENVRPWRVCGLDARTRSVLMLPVGQIARAKISPGDQLALTHQPLAHLSDPAGTLAPFLRYAAAARPIALPSPLA
jgi:uncharacterized protein